MRTKIVLLLAWTVGYAWGQEIPQATLAGRSIALKLVKAEDLSPIPWPKEEVSLKQTSTRIAPDQNIYMLLQANGIAPDSEAFAIVYDLNPLVKDLGSSIANTSLQLPQIVGGPKTAAVLKSGALVELTVDPELRDRISASVAAMQSLAATSSQFGSQSETQDQIHNLLQWFQAIDSRFKRRTDPPLTHDTIQQMAYEAALLQSILENSRSRSEPTSSEQQQIAAIYDDIKLDMKQYGQVLAEVAPKAPDAYDVTVNIKGKDQNFISALRVYYVVNGMFPQPPASPPIDSPGFRRLGSGQTERLSPQKNYKVWAAKDGDPSHPVTPPYPLLRPVGITTSPVTVDLSLSSGSNR